MTLPEARSPDIQTPDPGLFGPGSMVWRVHSDPAMLIGGLRALLYQALNPRSMAAMDQQSDFRSDPWKRFNRTSDYVGVTTFGTTEEARAYGRRVRDIHRAISGTDPVTGRAYRADDPELLMWIHAVEVDSFLSAYQTYSRPLDGTQADRYVDEMRRAAHLVGLTDEDTPTSVAELDAYLDGMTGLAMTRAVREASEYVLNPPMPFFLRPLWKVPIAAAIAILPERARTLYGFEQPVVARAATRPAIFTLLRTFNTLLPGSPYRRRALARLEQ